MMGIEVFYLFLVLFVYDMLKSIVLDWLHPKDKTGDRTIKYEIEKKHWGHRLVFAENGMVFCDDCHEELGKGVIEHGNPKGKG